MPLSTRTTPANSNERAQVIPLLDTLFIRTGKRGRPRKRLKVIAADKGYDAKELRQRLRRRGIRPQIPKRVWKTKKPRGRPLKKDVPRFQAERTCAWFQRKYRRLVVRWERLAACFKV
jgi:IS5 family transposase